MKYRYVIIFVSILFSCCRNDRQNITIQGTVNDTDNGVPLAGVSVTIICWKYGNSPDASYTESETKVTTTDENGRYQMDFDKGAFVEIEVSMNNYINGNESMEICKSKNTINISLQKKQTK
ncbi:MAG: carboxypeptidase-like regulatory domain-containing protein [Bacteroidales bacterium]|nr:carboxypeptidase-like regulatory domain-containing protein [Bacteroidales bacterium]